MQKPLTCRLQDNHLIADFICLTRIIIGFRVNEVRHSAVNFSNSLHSLFCTMASVVTVVFLLLKKISCT